MITPIFNQQDKWLIAAACTKKYESRWCHFHGVFQFLKNADEKKCRYCLPQGHSGIGHEIENIEELQKQFREEIKWFSND